MRFRGPDLATILWAASFIAICAYVTLARPAADISRRSDWGRRIQPVAGTTAPRDPFRRETDIYWGQGVASYLLIARDPQHTVGTSTLADGPLLDSALLRRAFPNLSNLKLILSMRGGPIGSGPEAVIARDPTALITVRWAAEIFRTFGLPVHVVSDRVDEAGLRDDTLTQAAVAGQRDRGRNLVARFAKAMAVLDRDTAGIAPTRVAVLGTDGPGVFWISNTPLTRSMDTRAKADNVLPSLGFHRLDIETLLAVDPDVIVLKPSNLEYTACVERFTSSDWARGLKAVRTNRVFAAPQLIAPFGYDAIQLPLYNRWLAQVLHPGRLNPDVKRFFADTVKAELNVEPIAEDIHAAFGARECMHGRRG